MLFVIALIFLVAGCKEPDLPAPPRGTLCTPTPENYCNDCNATPCEAWYLEGGKCVAHPLDTPTGQINACFPVADAPALVSGRCVHGACVPNDGGAP